MKILCSKREGYFLNNEDLVLKMILDESGFSQGLNSAVKSYKALMLKLIEQDKRRSLGSIWTSFVGNF